MIDVTTFAFLDRMAQSNSSAKIVEVPRSTATKDEIISLLAKALGVPDYFGANWDALDECLRDLSWLKECVLVIRHDGVPRLPVDVLRMYLDILARAVESWRGKSEHEVVVTFPASAREEIAMMTKGPVSGLDLERPS
jgi:hypothetical protein